MVQVPEMQRSWLIQRLERPHAFMMGGKAMDNPFSFGGGLRNGGLSPEAMDILREVWSFDYMGAAEFEFGAVPEALQRIAKFAGAGKLKAHSFEFDKGGIQKHWSKDAKKPTGTATIYVLAPDEWMPEVEARIVKWATDRYNQNLKETTHLAEVLDPINSFAERMAGWLELDNGFMFFTDKEMFDKTCELFEVSHE
jgi:hypothetical protein